MARIASIVEGEVSETVRVLLADAQTSGGLLIACPPGRTAELLAALEGEGDAAWVVGRVTAGPCRRDRRGRLIALRKGANTACDPKWVWLV